MSKIRIENKSDKSPIWQRTTLIGWRRRRVEAVIVGTGYNPVESAKMSQYAVRCSFLLPVKSLPFHRRHIFHYTHIYLCLLYKSVLTRILSKLYFRHHTAFVVISMCYLLMRYMHFYNAVVGIVRAYFSQFNGKKRILE